MRVSGKLCEKYSFKMALFGSYSDCIFATFFICLKESKKNNTKFLMQKKCLILC